MMTTPAGPAPEERLGVLAQLLHRAAEAACAEADRSPPFSALAWGGVGLSATLAHHRVAGLLPEGYAIDTPEPESDDPVALLTQAEQLACELGADTVQGAGLAPVVVQVCDLLREATRVGG